LVCKYFFSECVVSVRSSFAPEELLRRDLLEWLLRMDTARGRLELTPEGEKSEEGESGEERAAMVSDERRMGRSSGLRSCLLDIYREAAKGERRQHHPKHELQNRVMPSGALDGRQMPNAQCSMKGRPG
jgi:hypothetical protein